jgi:hypothetical protein
MQVKPALAMHILSRFLVDFIVDRNGLTRTTHICVRPQMVHGASRKPGMPANWEAPISTCHIAKRPGGSHAHANYNKFDQAR